VCKLEQVIGVDLLIIPGGESTTKAAAVQSDDGWLRSGPNGPKFRLGIFLFLKIDFWY
jgi:hypothetical protein